MHGESLITKQQSLSVIARDTRHLLSFHLLKLPLYKLSNIVVKICGFHDCDYEEWRLPGCYAVWLL
jgi:hypothetical protein